MEVVLGLVTIMISAAGAILTSGAAPAAVHSETVSHRGASYDVAYQAQIVGGTRTIGAATGARPTAQRCIVTARVAVERSIAKPGSADRVTALLPAERVLTNNLPGNCVGRSGEPVKLADNHAETVRAHLAQVALDDRSQALAAIDSAHSLAVN